MNALRSNLELAIERAEHKGGCRYVDKGSPVCVIAQLGFIEGLSIEEINQWYGTIMSVYSGVPEFQKYDKELLSELQLIWDHPYGEEQDSRDAMRKLVQEYFEKEI
jgi:hypothetical protein